MLSSTLDNVLVSERITAKCPEIRVERQEHRNIPCVGGVRVFITRSESEEENDDVNTWNW
jgi:hypothetical protein